MQMKLLARGWGSGEDGEVSRRSHARVTRCMAKLERDVAARVRVVVPVLVNLLGL